MNVFQKNFTIGLNYGPTSAYPSLHLKMFRSKAIQVLSLYYSGVFYTH